MQTSLRFRVPLQHLDDHTIDAVKDHLLRVASRSKAAELQLDLASVETITSAGIGLVITLHRRLSTAGGHLVLCNVRDEISELFRLTRLDTLVDIRRPRPHHLPN